MPQHNSGSRRSRTHREQRAVRWLGHEAAKSRKVGGNNDGLAPTVFKAMRVITNPDDVLNYELIRDLRRETTAKTLTKLCVSLITTGEARKLASHNNDPTWSRRSIDALGQKAMILPDELDGFCVRAMITGTRKKDPGPRFVGLLVNQQTARTVIDERGQLLRSLPNMEGVSELKTPTPHVAVFETRDQAVAESLLGGLNEALQQGQLAIHLGPVDVEPALYRPPAYRGGGGY